MQLYLRQVRSKPAIFHSHIVRNLCLEAVSLAVLTATVILIQESRNGETSLPSDSVEPAAIGATAGLSDAQYSVRESRIGDPFSADAFNADRNRKIAKDTSRLLALALALRSELLNRSPTGPQGEDAIKKAREIEKLADKVKDAMRINPNLPDL